MAVLSGERQPELSLLSLDRQRDQTALLKLDGWELEPGTQLEDDPTTGQLVAALRPLAPGEAGRRPLPARPMRLPTGGATSVPAPLGPPVRQVLWLPPGAVASE